MPVRLSTHYYVISLSRQTAALFEAFRDTLIDVQNHGFPVDASTALIPSARPGRTADEYERLLALLRVVDERFGHYYRLEPMVVVVTGEEELQTTFTSVTSHNAAIVGRVYGDFSGTSLRDLGKIVWPVVKESMSGLLERTLRDWEIAADARKICGLDTVGRRVNEAREATLLVEEDFHMRGSISEADGSGTISPSVDVRDEIDDVVDMLIERVMENGGNVIFMPDDSLSKRGRIVLLLREAEDAL